MVRLLGALGITARLKVGRTAKSTCDTYWICVSGADQLLDCLWLFPADEQEKIVEAIQGQSKRIRPTGYRATKGTSWVRVVSVDRVPYDGSVYSVEVDRAHTVVTSFGLVAHNCFPKDTKALVKIAEDAGYDFWLLNGVIDVNLEQYARMVSKIEAACPDGTLGGRTIGVWGMTFKAMTDDLRDSPALEVIGRLLKSGASVQAYDPTVPRSRAESDSRLAGITICDDAYAVCAGADLLVVLTEWDEFRWLDFNKVRDQLAVPSIVDCRNMLDPAPLRRRGFTYVGVGRS
jgi:UDPglucose 6-dehydrogenase